MQSNASLPSSKMGWKSHLSIDILDTQIGVHPRKRTNTPLHDSQEHSIGHPGPIQSSWWTEFTLVKWLGLKQSEQRPKPDIPLNPDWLMGILFSCLVISSRYNWLGLKIPYIQQIARVFFITQVKSDTGSFQKLPTFESLKEVIFWYKMCGAQPWKVWVGKGGWPAGARWFGIRIGYPLRNNPFDKGIPIIQTNNPDPNQQLIQEISNRTYVSRTPKKPEYLITRSQLTWSGVRWDSVPFNFSWSISGGH